MPCIHPAYSDVKHRHDGSLEAALGTGNGGQLVRAHRKRVHVGAAPARQCGDQIGANALRREAHRLVDARVHHPGAAVAAHGPAAHGFNPARHHQIFHAAHHLGRSQVHGLQARRTKAAERDAGHCLRPAGVQHRRAGDVGALLTHRRDATQHQVVHQPRIQSVTLLHRLQQRAQQPHGAGLVQSAVLFALAAQRAHVVLDKGLRHAVLGCVVGASWGQRRPGPCVDQPLLARLARTI